MNILYDERLDGAAPKLDKGAVRDSLAQAVPGLMLLHREEDLHPFECDGLSVYRTLPMLVALPETLTQVEELLKTCHRLGVPVVILAGLGLGLLFGLINGIGITLVRIPPFIMTLGTMVILRGLALTLADGRPIDVANSAADFAWIGRGSAFGLPVAVWIFIVVAVFSLFILRFTPFGRNVYAVGSNAEAAHLSGINVELTKIGVYSISGFLAALTALIFVSRLTVGEPTAGTGLELEAIAIAVIGGTSLFGGQGGVLGTVIGAAILAILANIMNLIGISPFTQQMVKGAIIIIAVSMEVFRRRR